MDMIENLDIYHFFQDSVQDVSLVFLTALFVAWFIGQDFNNRVLQHEIAGGYSRFSIIISRVIPVALASVAMHVIYISFDLPCNSLIICNELLTEILISCICNFNSSISFFLSLVFVDTSSEPVACWLRLFLFLYYI